MKNLTEVQTDKQIHLIAKWLPFARRGNSWETACGMTAPGQYHLGSNLRANVTCAECLAVRS